MKAVAYVRVSTEKQADHGVSLEAQVEKAKAMAMLQSADLVDIIVDGGASAKSLDRPGMKSLLSLVDSKKVDTVIVCKLDRLTRSVKDLAELLERFNRRGVALVSVAESLDTATAAGRLVINMLISVSQWEREAIGERTRSAMQFKKSKGERVGNIEFGFRVGPDGKHLEPDPSETKIVKRIVALRAKGNSLRVIAATLNRAGLTTRRGTPWQHVYVSGVLRNL
ncbi:MAG: recombinase family protein [Bryobacteraceae bacterium]